MENPKHIEQRRLVEKCIEHLEIAKSYCELAWDYATDPHCSMMADHEPWQYDNVIKNAKEQLCYIGGEWVIEKSVCPWKED
jgi:hypothetical protein